MRGGSSRTCSRASGTVFGLHPPWLLFRLACLGGPSRVASGFLPGWVLVWGLGGLADGGCGHSLWLCAAGGGPTCWITPALVSVVPMAFLRGSPLPGSAGGTLWLLIGWARQEEDAIGRWAGTKLQCRKGAWDLGCK